MRGVLVALTVVVVARSAAAQPAEGERHYKQAAGHYAAGRYDEALVELEAARSADPQPLYLFSIAQAYRLKGDCKHAIAAYGDYLRTGPTPAATKATQLFIDECNARLDREASAAANPLEEPTTAPPPAPPPPPSEPLVIREVQRVVTREITLPWYRDTWGNTLVGAGVAAGVFGAFAAWRGSVLDNDATVSPTYDRFDSNLAARDRWQTTAAVSFIAGGALVVGGLLHYALRPRRVRTEVLVDPGTGTAAVGVSWTTP